MPDIYRLKVAVLALTGSLAMACGSSDSALDTDSNWQDEAIVSAGGVSVLVGDIEYAPAGNEHSLYPVPERDHTWRMKAPPSVRGFFMGEFYFRNETTEPLNVISVRSEGSFEARRRPEKDIEPGNNLTITFYQTGLDPAPSRIFVETSAGSFQVEVEMGEVLEPNLRCDPTRIPLSTLRSNSTPFSCHNPLPTTFDTTIRYTANSTAGFSPSAGSSSRWPRGRTTSKTLFVPTYVFEEGSGFSLHFMFDETTVATIEFY